MSPRHSIETSDEAGVRYLHFGSDWVQGAMRIARPWALELAYTQEMMGCLLLRTEPDWPRQILQVGLGAASLTKWWYRHRPSCQQTIIEINPAVVAVARQAFKLPQDEARIAIHIADGVEWMQPESKVGERFDCIMIDGYDHHARFGGLGSEAFYRHCRTRLKRQGILVLNLFGRSRGYRTQLAHLSAVFGDRVLALPPVDGGNAIVFAALDDFAFDPDAAQAAVAQLHRDTGLKLGATLARLQQAWAGR
ncbi:MAG: fused MFS/spermidine synthase [Betaproteobacteria bacterium]|nr:fused MFS/spermidine synthase [Betaproteobacteria bacterium]